MWPTIFLVMIILATIAGLYALIVARKKSSNSLGDFGNGILGLSTMIALIAAAWLYVFEGHIQPRVDLSATATVIGIVPPAARRMHSPENVLIHVSITIENRGELGRWFSCAAIDVVGLEGTEGRSLAYPDDLTGNSLLPASPDDRLLSNCVSGFEEPRRREDDERLRGERSERTNPPSLAGPARTGGRYRDFYMEPGERTTRTWEQIVPCRFNAVRVIFKLPKPDSTHEYETKLLVPIADICRGQRLIAHYPPAD